jgi:hypothetical protein
MTEHPHETMVMMNNRDSGTCLAPAQANMSRLDCHGNEAARFANQDVGSPVAVVGGASIHAWPGAASTVDAAQGETLPLNYRLKCRSFGNLTLVYIINSNFGDLLNNIGCSRPRALPC